MRVVPEANMIQKEIKNLIKEVLKKLKIEEVDFVIEHPEDFKNGDYSTNIAMICAKNLKTNPRELAEKIVNEINKNLPNEIEKVETASMGFINFFLSGEFYKKSLKNILEKKDSFGKNNNLNGQKTMIEYTDPNPFKEFHIGHLMSNTIGESISRIVEWNGAEVKRACYQGDVGIHIAQAVWGMQNRETNAYVAGARAYKENEEAKKEIIEINKKIYDKDPSIFSIYEKGKKASLEYFESIYKKLGTKFDFYFFESETVADGVKIVEKNIGKIFEKGDGGAIIFKAENFDKHLHTRVFINSEGLPTYEAKELSLPKIKYDKYKYDKSIIITGNEINDYFKVLLCAMKQIFPELAEKTIHLSHGMLRLPNGKMSSRTGDVITAENLIEEVKQKVKNDEMVAIGAIKYMILRSSVGSDIVFDIDKSISTEGDSGVYLQYAYVRAKSVVEKGIKDLMVDFNVSEERYVLEKMLYRFEEVVEEAGKEYAPHYLITYLTEVAALFNGFYANNLIINNKDKNLSSYRLALANATKIILKNGLNILGISAPERM